MDRNSAQSYSRQGIGAAAEPCQHRPVCTSSVIVLSSCSLSTAIHHHSRAGFSEARFGQLRGSDSFHTKRRVGFLATTPAFFVSGCFFADVAAPPAATQVQRRVRRPHVKFVCFIRVQFRDPPRSTGTAFSFRSSASASVRSLRGAICVRSPQCKRRRRETALSRQYALS
jgi:hypothetical protein